MSCDYAQIYCLMRSDTWLIHHIRIYLDKVLSGLFQISISISNSSGFILAWHHQDVADDIGRRWRQHSAKYDRFESGFPRGHEELSGHRLRCIGFVGCFLGVSSARVNRLHRGDHLRVPGGCRRLWNDLLDHRPYPGYLCSKASWLLRSTTDFEGE